jgi:hypothetical protein
MSIIAWIVLGLIAGFIGSKLVNKTGGKVLPRHRPRYRRRRDRGLVVQPVWHARGHRVERLQSHRGRHRSGGVLGDLPRDPTHCVIPARTFYTTGMEHSPTSATGTGWERSRGGRCSGRHGKRSRKQRTDDADYPGVDHSAASSKSPLSDPGLRRTGHTGDTDALGRRLESA